MKNKALLVLGLLLPASLFAQDTLRLEEAVAIALDQNFSILVARNNVKINDNLASPGNAGLLPVVGADGGYTYSNNDTRTELADGTIIEQAGAQSTSLNGSVGVNYLIFDGLGNYYTYKSLKAIKNLSEAEARVAIENTIVQVTNAYFQVALLQENLNNAREALQISRDRLRRLEVRQEYGTAVTAEVLNASVDLNTDSVTVLNSIIDYQNAKRSLNFLLARSVTEDFAVKIDVAFREDFDLERLLALSLDQNADVVSARINQRVAKIDYKLAMAEYFPTLSLNTSYGYSRSDQEASFLLNSRNLGFNAGATVGWNIFSGNQIRTQVQNAKISIENSELQLKQAVLDTERELINAWSTYQNALFVLEAEQANQETAQANFQRMQELYNVGQITTTQFREAQLNLLRSRTAINNALYTAKLSEIELSRISGGLIREIEE